MSREKLAYIVKVESVNDIPGKDRIKSLTFEDLGWTIIGDNTYSVGDEVVFIEAETILPEKPEFEFLRKRCWSEKHGGFKIKPMKMGGVVSYGICFKQQELQGLIGGYNKTGKDLTSAIGVQSIDILNERLETKKENSYAKNMPILRRIRYIFNKTKNTLFTKWHGLDYPVSFPGEILGRTDETRIENINYIFETYQQRPYEATIKMDGSSVTVGIYNDALYICTRNRIIYEGKLSKAKELFKKNPSDIINLLSRAGKIQSDMDEELIKWVHRLTVNGLEMLRYCAGDYTTEFDRKNFFIQGEICGPGIQKNPLELKEARIYIFNMCFPDLKTGSIIRYFSWGCMNHILMKFSTFNFAGLQLVPYLQHGSFEFKDVSELKKLAEGKYECTDNHREGIVIRFLDLERDDFIDLPGREMSNSASFKCINDSYLLKKES